MSSLGDQLYSGSAQAGKIFTLFSLIVAVVFSIVALIVGIVFLTKKNVYTQQTTATITAANCSIIPQTSTYNCNLTLQYNVKGQEYTPTVQVDSQIMYTIGSKITIYYNPDNPSSFTINQINYRVIGIILIVSAIVMVGIAYFWYWASRSSKFIAAGAGVAGVWNLFR